MAHGRHLSKVVTPQSTSYLGPFGRICGDLSPWIPRDKDCRPIREEKIDEAFLKFANEHMVERPGLEPADLFSEDTIKELNAEFSTGKTDDPSTGIPAAYTYFGQFVDHDITFDPASSLLRQNDPDSLLNFRTPRLDLDNLYGRGPHDQPYMFGVLGDKAERKLRKKLGAFSFVIGKVTRGFKRDSGGSPELEAKGNPKIVNVNSDFEDLPRCDNGSAVIGDMRNDENAIVSQMQLAFLKAHNTLLERALEAGSCTPFEDARRTLRWLYQWIVWHDFVRRITSAHAGLRAKALHMKSHPAGGKTWELGLGHVYRWKHHPFMPVEFAAAAYRFGHSMVRNAYQTNLVRGFNVHAPLFDGSEDGAGDLRGFRKLIKENVIQWDWFLPMKGQHKDFPQRARRIDTKLANALSNLAGESKPMNVLAYRNLKRGWAFGLPKGSDVARKFTCDNGMELNPDEPESLWYYILKEAETQGKNGESLGPLGTTMICAVFAGLLKGDPASWVNVHPCWRPESEPLLQAGKDNIDSKDETDPDHQWQLASIIRLAGVPSTGKDFVK